MNTDHLPKSSDMAILRSGLEDLGMEQSELTDEEVVAAVAEVLRDFAPIVRKLGEQIGAAMQRAFTMQKGARDGHGGD